MQKQIQLEKTSLGFKKIFILKFTESLIKGSVSPEFWELGKKILEEEKIKNKNLKSKKFKEKNFENFEAGKIFSFGSGDTMGRGGLGNSTRTLTIPKQRLPPWLNYLRPAPTNLQIDLGKLNHLLQDPSVREIICDGPDKNISVNSGGRKNTNIILTKKEIENVIQKFSQVSKIPMQEGVFRVAVGKLIFYSIISKVVGSKFIIRKMLF